MMREVRRREQKKAAFVGDFAAVVLLDHPSAAVKDPRDSRPVDDLVRDPGRDAARGGLHAQPGRQARHPRRRDAAHGRGHPSAAAPSARPGRLYGCEVWRDLDWLPDDEKVAFDLSAHENLQAALVAIFDSQICGGKRYDLATQGRRRAHATYAASHGTDVGDLAQLRDGPDAARHRRRGSIRWRSSPAAIDRFRADVTSRVRRFQGNGSHGHPEVLRRYASNPRMYGTTGGRGPLLKRGSRVARYFMSMKGVSRRRPMSE